MAECSWEPFLWLSPVAVDPRLLFLRHFVNLASLMKLLWTNTYSDAERHVDVLDMVGFR